MYLVHTFLYKVIFLSSWNGFLSFLIENRCHGEVDRWPHCKNTRISSTKSRFVSDSFIFLNNFFSCFVRREEGGITVFCANWNVELIDLNISASRTKMMVVNNFSKVRGTTKSVPYPQAEGTLGEHMIRHGKDLGEDMMFGECMLLTRKSCVLLQWNLQLSLHIFFMLNILTNISTVDPNRIWYFTLSIYITWIKYCQCRHQLNSGI